MKPRYDEDKRYETQKVDYLECVIKRLGIKYAMYKDSILMKIHEIIVNKLTSNR